MVPVDLSLDTQKQRIAERQDALMSGKVPVDLSSAYVSTPIPELPELGKTAASGASARAALAFALKRDAVCRRSGRPAYERLGFRRQAVADFTLGKHIIAFLRSAT